MTTKEMINVINAYLSASGFECSEDFAAHYCLGLKCKGIVMLAGNSDTDKALFVKLFAEAVGATTENGRFLPLAVQPDWLAGSDLFGRVNASGVFLPGVLIDFIKRAQLDCARPYFLCLEGVNLSSVEYYLGDIVRGLEARTQTDKTPLLTEKYYGADAAAAEKYGAIYVPDNLYVVGTVNMDEASYPLNQKFLDRVHTMEFSKDTLRAGRVTGQPVAADAPNALFLPRFTQIIREGENWDFVLRYFDAFQQINAILTKARAYIEYTLRDDVILYLLNNLDASIMEENTAMDFALIQKVLPRVQGSSKTVGTALDLLLEYCDGKYPKTVEKLQQMKAQLAKDDYAALWM